MRSEERQQSQPPVGLHVLVAALGEVGLALGEQLRPKRFETLARDLDLAAADRLLELLLGLASRSPAGVATARAGSAIALTELEAVPGALLGLVREDAVARPVYVLLLGNGELVLQLGEPGSERGDLRALRRAGSWRAKALLK
jgi:hypothetical protein